MINVLIVEDDPKISQLNTAYLGQISGFHCHAAVATLPQALMLLSDYTTRIDLVLLDIHVHQENGLELLPILRKREERTEVIIISAAKDANTVRRALHYGVVDYLIKPVPFNRFKAALERYQQQLQLLARHECCGQDEVDSLLRRLPGGNNKTPKLPKGLTSITLGTACEWIGRQNGVEFTTDTLAQAIGVSRISCRKYLIYLTEINILSTRVLNGSTGRPHHLYQLKAEALPQLQAYYC
ncbi:two-component system response regulator DcuR [Gibbsiella quercinecans]|uniref:two-component system response regulator DcuR n=1 Tax=Gibbsiella quercinecans TaxID=929813 RepID=UPI00242E4FC9|nr:two-component system response regulator DcuR [Gibbsiella quercinecans]